MAHLVFNAAARTSAPPGLLTAADCEAVRRFYDADPAYRPTPLVRRPALARRLGLGEILIKDESGRFGLSAFKIAGALYACQQLKQAGRLASGGVVVCATAGNHGRAVAHAARRYGLTARIYVPRGTAEAAIEAIAGEGAQVVRHEGRYEEAVRRAAVDAERNGWTVVSDTSWPGYEEIPRWIMAGYTRIFDEAERQWAPDPPPDVVIVQAGVGGLAGAAASWLRLDGRPARLYAICAEPADAACVLASIRAGRPAAVAGPLRTEMAGLRCSEISPVAWPMLAAGFDAFVAIEDEWSFRAMRALAGAGSGEPAVVAGPSGACGLGALVAVLEAPELAPVREAARLGPASRVLVINTEGATDPEQYQRVMARRSM